MNERRSILTGLGGIGCAGCVGYRCVTGQTGAAARLRFPALEIVTQRLTQPILPGDVAVLDGFVRRVSHGLLWSMITAPIKAPDPGNVVVTGTYELDSLLQQTINRWHDFVTTGDPERLSPFNDADKMIDSEAMIRPMKALAGGRRGDRNRIDPQLARLNEAAAG